MIVGGQIVRRDVRASNHSRPPHLRMGPASIDIMMRSVKHPSIAAHTRFGGVRRRKSCPVGRVSRGSIHGPDAGCPTCLESRPAVGESEGQPSTSNTHRHEAARDRPSSLRCGAPPHSGKTGGAHAYPVCHREEYSDVAISEVLAPTRLPRCARIDSSG